jgi:hypothetical protein
VNSGASGTRLCFPNNSNHEFVQAPSKEEHESNRLEESLRWTIHRTAAVLAIGAAPDARKPAEYKVVTGDIWTGEFQKKLNDTAADGWQLQKADSFAERHGFAILTRDKH